ncbi:MAG: acetamidase/formamidase family protein [Tessaracoccus sp.]|uniref:acetamidase/formamidase family protein n=1 Tax=Tessaracoccus sp. TaxID=1971211 RepID=UPI001ECEA629|nr:acetamidase/formamidase family protein [Tessaracoccus sp.]MBK7821381.1 acetamidase/formamidase family protein [Tessaracoccus sp.]
MTDPHTPLDAKEASALIESGVGRRGLLLAAAAMGVGSTIAATSTTTAAAHPRSKGSFYEGVLQPGKGRIRGDHYLPSRTGDVLWGYVPTVHAAPAMSMRSGQTVTIDSVSHEGILEDQGRDPVSWLGGHGVKKRDVLTDAIDIAANYRRTTRSFDVDGPHVVTGPIRVKGAKPGDVLKVETLDLRARVPYGVVSSRHGKGALAITPAGEAPAGISMGEVMPPHATDNRSSGIPTDYGNVSVFTSVEGKHGVMRSGRRKLRFPVNPFFGMMGVAYSEAPGLTDPSANSIPPTLGGGNIDIRHLGAGSTFYLPVVADGALFYVGDPHHAMGDGEVALTAMEGSLRGTFRLTVCKKGSGDAPKVAFRYPFAETATDWIAIGLSDPNGSIDGQGSDLNIAMRRAVVNALDFLEQDKGLNRAVAYAYLSAAANFSVTQVVDRTTGVHGLIRKRDLA